jgi:hypothetical protein
MRDDLGRFFEGRLLETITVMKTVYDAATGAGADVNVWIDGREMVFGKSKEATSRGFLRMIPGEATVVIAFPKGNQILDKQKRTKGYPGSQMRMTLAHPSDVDTYVRRMIEVACALDA